ncbi:HNH endonuclease [Lichenihabitans psoromatis]|uniref:HNH endonuclease n=1 Tax=Lichenihabitans psoromatis TaxID=2528642 RepID=UPI001FE0685A|nr:HNH endonuclease [Lichenihabitans psoromatis]
MPFAPNMLRPRGQALGQANSEYEARRGQQPWRTWYKTARWRTLRQWQLNTEPLCRICTAEDRLTPATVCDHVMPHRGDEALFWSGPFQSLCERCHSRDKQREERAGSSIAARSR